MSKVYGLTGGISSGKSTISGFFREAGIPVIDADQVSRDISQKGQPVWVKIKENFGKEVFNTDDSLNREKLAQIIFSDPQKRKQLEVFTHPLIMKKVREGIQDYQKKGAELVLVEAALLIEADYAKEFDGLILVTCPVEVQIERLYKSKQMPREKALKIIQAQLPMEEKIKKARVSHPRVSHPTYVIDNSGTLDQVQKATQKILDTLKKKL